MAAPRQFPNFFWLLYGDEAAPDDLTALGFVAVKPCAEVGDVVVHVLLQGCAEALARRTEALERRNDFRGALGCRSGEAELLRLKDTDSVAAGPVTRIAPALFELLLGGSIPANLAGLAWVAVRGDRHRGMLAEAAPQQCVAALAARAEELRAKRGRSQADLSAAQRCADLAVEMAGAVGPSARLRVTVQVAVESVGAAAAAARLDAEAAAATACSAEVAAAAAGEQLVAVTARCDAAESAVSAAVQLCAELTERLQRVERESVEVAAERTEELKRVRRQLSDARMHAELLQVGAVRLRPTADPASVVAVLLPQHANVSELKEAAHKRGGPKPSRQELRVGERLLDVSGLVLLSRSDLIRRVPLRAAADGDGPVVEVTERKPHPAAAPVVSAGKDSVVVLLDGGGLLELGRRKVKRPPTDVTFACAGTGFVAVVTADGQVQVCGEGKEADRVRSDLPRLEGREVVCCSVAEDSFAAVTACGRLVLCGPINESTAVPSRLQGRVAAAAIGGRFVVAVTEDGRACSLARDAQETDIDLGGRAVVSVSAGWAHYALLLDDGSVRCGGDNDGGRCDVPAGLRDVVSCSCGLHLTVALHRDGTLSWWGGQRLLSSRRRVMPDIHIFATERIAAVSVHRYCVAAVTTDGRLLVSGGDESREAGLHDLPSDRISYRRSGGGVS